MLLMGDMVLLGKGLMWRLVGVWTVHVLVVDTVGGLVGDTVGDRHLVGVIRGGVGVMILWLINMGTTIIKVGVRLRRVLVLMIRLMYRVMIDGYLMCTG